MKRKILCLLLALSLCLALCGCGGVSYGVNTIMTLETQHYSMAFRNGDSVYFYVVAALEELNAEGAIAELARKWLGSNMVSFGKKANALAAYTPPEPRVFIIGVDENSFPFAYGEGGNYWGFDVELATKLCQKLGWTLQVHVVEKENVYIELYSGNIDCAWGGLALPQKEVDDNSYTVYGPYVKNDIVIASRDGSNIWNSLQLNGRRMAMCTTAEAMEALQSSGKVANRLGQITRLAGGTTECFSYLFAGKCDLILTDSTAIAYYNSH
jgi:ABC-type amino acid transport substrate-binding protein